MNKKSSIISASNVDVYAECDSGVRRQQHQSMNWRIVGMHHWYNAGDTAFTSHHLVIVPDSSLLSAAMNDSK